MNDETLQDVSLAVGEDGVAIVTIDVPGEKMNILKESFFPAMQSILNEIRDNDAVKAAVIVSGKPDSFIAGADIHIIEAVETEEQAERLCGLGHAIMDRIAGSHKPFVVAINGVALGGGCELALACQARIASDDPKTALGLPEVQLGVLPGFGGSQRLPRLIGIAPALDMMLTGRHIKAGKAKRLGLVDEVVPKPILLSVAVKKALSLIGTRTADKTGWRRALTVQGLQTLALERNPFGRRILFDQARKRLLAKTRGNYPAPEKILELVRTGIEQPLATALANEIKAFAQLAVTPEAKQLMGIYFSQTALKKETFVKGDVEPRLVRKVGILGGGLMGAGIAMVSLDRADADVRIKDINDSGIRNAMKHAYEYYEDKIQRRSISRADARRKLHRFTGALDYSGFKKADLVIEAVFEDLQVKKQMVQDIEALGNEHTIFATNTSSIPIKDIARGAQRPENIIGMHYFSPVEKMPLLEIIKHSGTSEETIASCVRFGKAQGKTVIVVKDVAGFFVNRILFPYINEAGHLAMEGVPFDLIDKSLTQWGFPVGPFKLLDEVGVDVGVKVQHILEAAYGARMQASPIVDKLVADKRIGKKVKKGFYDYSGTAKGKTIDPAVYRLLDIKPGKSPVTEEIVDRCILPLLNEAALCLEKKVIGCARDGDTGAVFGIGFPPFRGGPFKYIDSIGAATIVEKLQRLEQQHGERFTPAPGLLKMAENGKKYY